MGVMEDSRAFPSASWGALILSSHYSRSDISDQILAQVMETYCFFLMENFIALPAFTNEYGVLDEETGKHFITTPWQSALGMGGPVGAFISVFLAGHLTSKIGYHWETIWALIRINAFIFVLYFANSLGVMLASQLLEGIPWGIFIANIYRTSWRVIILSTS
ncbi:MFS transporter, SP family, general alpha glucoside:H+ symporter [Exophiala aquamarina CBS 119918]|uniref:MFS transporter, SP family, general alpha glucoside:H+ symporter n=1 Tax=Exophiala aquamarina CBS 119918 TaxID=1182545 RepID=A0A072PFU1_9EURO|nr:MFS transporter, SP family, general alpha glucoside:H+ symporter [Exophiala aquamarina CBS 119918]KEF58716.1 MFS transporter, SP family, general alpha glucoside:H+ symporter [Exophiala aquamarina CBS 119918]